MGKEQGEQAALIETANNFCRDDRLACTGRERDQNAALPGGNGLLDLFKHLGLIGAKIDARSFSASIAPIATPRTGPTRCRQSQSASSSSFCVSRLLPQPP
jgi:hypothetical protein